MASWFGAEVSVNSQKDETNYAVHFLKEPKTVQTVVPVGPYSHSPLFLIWIRFFEYSLHLRQICCNLLWMRPCRSALENMIETLAPRSRDQDLSKMNSSALESQDLGLGITTLGLLLWCCWRRRWRHWATLTFDLVFRSAFRWALKSGRRPKFNLTLDLDFRWAKVQK